MCLALLAALLFQAVEPAQPALSLDRSAGAVASATPRESASQPLAAPAVVFPDEPEPIPAGVLTALELASGEPLEVELARLLDALQYGFGAWSVQVEPTLRPYAHRLAERLNVRPVTFRVRVSAPDGDLAEARAATLRNLFEAAGIAPGRLRVTAHRGAAVLHAEPI